MEQLLPDYYFNLHSFAHQALFERDKTVWHGLQNLKSYFATLALGNIEIEIHPAVYLEDPQLISIGKGCVIEAGAYIKGPCCLGEGCVVRHGAYIRGYLLAGERCVIGHDTEIKHAILLDEAHAAHFNYVGDSILGAGVNLGAGAKCANFKLDHKPVSVSLKGNKIETGMRKFGAIIGDGSQIGCNAVLNPGTCLGKQVQCHPCVNVSGFFPSGSFIKGTVLTWNDE